MVMVFHPMAWKRRAWSCGKMKLCAGASDPCAVRVIRQMLKSLSYLRLGEVSHLVEGHIVGVVDDDQVVKSIVAGVRAGLERHTLLEAPISAEGDDVVVNDGVAIGVVLGASSLSNNPNQCVN